MKPVERQLLIGYAVVVICLVCSLVRDYFFVGPAKTKDTQELSGQSVILLALAILGYLAFCVHSGELYTRIGSIREVDQPCLFWLVIAVSTLAALCIAGWGFSIL